MTSSSLHVMSTIPSERNVENRRGAVITSSTGPIHPETNKDKPESEARPPGHYASTTMSRNKANIPVS
jgi:hypothetical protein